MKKLLTLQPPHVPLWIREENDQYEKGLYYKKNYLCDYASLMFYLSAKQGHNNALKELTTLAEQMHKNNVYAQYYLGILFSKGYVVQKDNKKAVKWFKLAANQGNQAALDNLIEMGKEKL